MVGKVPHLIFAYERERGAGSCCDWLWTWAWVRARFSPSAASFPFPSLPFCSLHPGLPPSLFTVRCRSALAWAGVSFRHATHGDSFPCQLSAPTLLHGQAMADLSYTMLPDWAAWAVSDSKVREETETHWAEWGEAETGVSGGRSRGCAKLETGGTERLQGEEVGGGSGQGGHLPPPPPPATAFPTVAGVGGGIQDNLPILKLYTWKIIRNL